MTASDIEAIFDALPRVAGLLALECAECGRVIQNLRVTHLDYTIDRIVSDDASTSFVTCSDCVALQTGE